ncbi:MAG: hypothetical protein IJ835_07630 [Muribaculaceae bacterium]|nr:hypothetical protein [Muribaculaceae bacterium]
MTQLDINKFKKPATAPFKPQQDYVDALAQRAANVALAREKARQTAQRPRRRLYYAAAAVAAIAIASSAMLMVFHSGNTADNSANRLAQIETSTAQAPSAAIVSDATAPDQPALDHAQSASDTDIAQATHYASTSVPPRTAASRAANQTTTKADNEQQPDPVDEFLNTLDSEQLMSLDYSYVDEIPDY